MMDEGCFALLVFNGGLDKSEGDGGKERHCIGQDG